MKSRRCRRESGRHYNKYYDPEEGFYNETYWDDWNDHRDGFRNIGDDRTMFIPKGAYETYREIDYLDHNKKIKMLHLRRKRQKVII